MRKAPVSHAAAASTSRRHVRGFTLIEVMIVVAIVAILAAVAIPNYRDYILRGQLADAPTLLSSFRANMERYYQDNRQYTAVGTKFYPPCDADHIPAAQRTQGKFVVSCTALTATTYTLTAAGTGSVADFAYTLTETGLQATTKVASGWTTSATCWVLKKGQLC